MLDTLALLNGPMAVSGHLGSWPPIGEEELEAVRALTSRGEISYYGREGVLADFEDAFKTYHNCKYALAVSSGTAALHSAFVACGIGPGDEVIAPTHTFLATVTPILATNGLPVLVDCEYDNEGIDPEAVAKAITPRTKALVVTHLWGHPVEMQPILSIAARHKLRVIEDCSHAHGSLYRGEKVGTLGDVGCFSLQSKKIVAAGQGGILITNDQDIYERAILFGHFRVRAEESVFQPDLRKFADTGYGLNYRIHPLGAALAMAQFPKLDDRIEQRRRRLEYLSQGISEIPGITPPTTRPHVTRGAFYGYKPRYCAEDLAGLSMDVYIRALRAEGLEIKRPGSEPLHLSSLFRGAPGGLANFTNSRADSRRIYEKGDCPVSERIHNVALSLPTFTYEPFSLIDEYLDGFRKVTAHLGDLLRIDSAQHKTVGSGLS
jgi:perosamine synthetase